MFFSNLFKNRTGNKDIILHNIFYMAVIVNIVGLVVSIMMILGCFFVNPDKIGMLIILSIITFVATYVLEVFLAWTSAILNSKTESKKK